MENRVRELRFSHGAMTQEQLANAIGVSRQTVIAMEQGRFCPSLESALKIGRVFNVPLEEIFQLIEGQ